MTLRNLFLPLSLVASIAVALPVGVAASGYDDDEDDIYYNPKKDKTATTQTVTASQPQQSVYVPNTVVDYPAADTYAVTGQGLNVDVDAYNRRTIASQNPDSISLEQLEQISGTAASGDTYTYTRRLEQYHNSDIVAGSGDQDLIDSYYSQPASNADINVYVVGNTWPYWSPYYNWYYPYYSYGWYSPGWYAGYPWYGPSLSWGWYDPWYSWSWGPVWTPGWRPGWNPGPPARPGSWNNPGSSRPHHPTASGSSSTAGRRPGAFSAGASNAARPGNMGQATRRGSSTTPSYQGVPSSRPTQSSGTRTVTNSRGRGYQSGNNSNSSYNSGSRSNSRSSYNSGSSRSSGSFGGGRSSGGTRSGGGGSHGRGR